MKCSKSLAALILAACLSSTAAGPCYADTNFADGQKLFMQKQYRAAATKFEAAMQANPRDANTVYYCALANHMCSNRSRARQLYQYVLTSFAGSKVASMAQDGLRQIDATGAASSSSGSGGSTSTVTTIGGGRSGSSGNPLDNSLPPEIKVELEKDGRSPGAYVNGTINGVGVKFHLDTGAFGTIIGQNQLEELGIARPANTEKWDVHGVGERTDVKAWEQTVNLQVGQIRRPNFKLHVQDRMEGRPLLGADFLGDFNIEVDEDGNKVVFRKKGGRQQTAIGTIDIPFTKVESGHLIVKALVNNKPCDMYFDTGADGVCFDLPTAKKYGFDPSDRAPDGISHGVAGETDTWHVNLESFKLGKVTRDNFRVSVVRDAKMGKPLLGQSAFNDYRYQVDHDKNVIHLAPR